MQSTSNSYFRDLLLATLYGYLVYHLKNCFSKSCEEQISSLNFPKWQRDNSFQYALKTF